MRRLTALHADPGGPIRTPTALAAPPPDRVGREPRSGCSIAWLANLIRFAGCALARFGLLTATGITAKGIRIGRPPVQIDLPAARALIDLGVSYRKAAKQPGIGTSTLHRILAADRLLAEASITRSSSGA